MTWGRVVLVLADALTAGDLCGRLGQAQGDLSIVTCERIEDRDDLGPRVATLGADVIGVVVDPELAAPDDRAALGLATQLLRTGRDLRVVLYAAATPDAMRAVLRVASCMPCELMVRGVDEMPTWTARTTAKIDAPSRPREALRQLTHLPARYRLAWLDAIEAPGAATVKRVAACASVERRTLERAHRHAGAWTPARLLRELQVHAKSALLGSSDPPKTTWSSRAVMRRRGS